jgi:hypothetical protein
MIDSTSSFDRASRTVPTPEDLTARASLQALQARDRLSTDKAQQLSEALTNQPEVRPDVVARGQALAGDPNYPSPAILSRVAGMIVNSPDLSEDQG